MVKLQVDYKFVSKAQRVYKFFKPNEVVQGEYFDLELIFQNQDDKFHGGSFQLVFCYPEGTTDKHAVIEIPPIDEGQSKTINLEDMKMMSSGNCGLMFLNQHRHTDGQGTVSDQIFIWDPQNNRLTEFDFINFPVASKEEIYQKFSLVVALGAFLSSIVALLISVTNLIITIL